MQTHILDFQLHKLFLASGRSVRIHGLDRYPDRDDAVEIVTRTAIERGVINPTDQVGYLDS